MTEDIGKVFLSHHSSTVQLAEHLANYLLRNGIDTWYAPRDIRPGAQWDESINQAIRNCKAMVLLFCTKADSSIQVKRELSLADRYKKPIFWLRVERVEPNNLSYFLTSTQWLDWLDMRDDTLEQLVCDLSVMKNEGCFGYEENISAPKIDTYKNSSSAWAKGILMFENEREASECVARVYFSLAQKSPDSSVVLPTG